MDLKDYSLLIQGPAHQHGFLMCQLFKDTFGEIIYSTEAIPNDIYEYCDKHKLFDNIQLVVSDLEEIKHVLPEDIVLYGQNFHKQVLTTFNGLEKCSKPFVIKMRSDEYFLGIDNIDYFVDEDLVNFTNIFFRHFETYPYHPSDHFFVARKDLLVATFSMLKDACYDNFDKFLLTTCQNPEVQLFAEQALCLALLFNITGKKIPFYDERTNIQLFHNYFNLFPCKSIGPYCMASLDYESKKGRTFHTSVKHSKRTLNSDCNSLKQYQ